MINTSKHHQIEVRRASQVTNKYEPDQRVTSSLCILDCNHPCLNNNKNLYHNSD